MAKQDFPYTEDINIPNGIALSFDVDGFSDFIASQGVTLVHFTAMICPVGKVDVTDVRKHEDHEGCSNGFIYTYAGECTSLFYANGKTSVITDFSRVDDSTAVVTFPMQYDDGTGPLLPCPFDRFYLKEETIAIANFEEFLAHESGVDKLKFPVINVISMADSRGKRFNQGSDFEVINGMIQWVGNRPAPRSVVSCRYTYRPFFYLDKLLHEIRVSQSLDHITGVRSVVRMPQQGLLVREFAFNKNLNDPLSANPSPRQAASPPTASPLTANNVTKLPGGFGPR